MKSKENKTPQDYSLEEILAEAKVMHGTSPSQENTENEERAERTKPSTENGADGKSDLMKERNRFGGKSYAEMIGEPEETNPEPKKIPGVPPVSPTTVPEQPVHPQPAPEITAPVMPEMPQPSQPAPGNGIRFAQELEEEELPRKRRGLFGLFGRRRKDECVYNSDEEDIYYGMQLKPIDEYREDYKDTAESHGDVEQKEPSGEHRNAHPTATFAYLFDESGENDVEDEIAARFEEIHRERQKRVAELLNESEPPKKIQPLYDHTKDTLNAAPKPAKADTADEIYSNSPAESDLPKTEILNPQAVHPAPQKTREKPQQAKPISKIKGNPVAAKRTVDNKKTTEFFMQLPKRRLSADMPPKEEPPKPVLIDEQAVKAAEPTIKPAQPVRQESAEAEREQPIAAQKSVVTAEPAAPVAQENKTAKAETTEKAPQEEKWISPSVLPEQPVPAEQQTAKSDGFEKSENTFDRKQRLKAVIDTAPKYTPLGKPVHVIELDNLRSVLQSEAQGYTVVMQAEPKIKPHLTPVPPITSPASEKPQELSLAETSDTEPQSSGDMSKQNEKHNIGIHKFNITGDEEEDDTDQPEELPEEKEELDDYNVPSDAPSISNELGTTIRELLLRFLVTGISTVLMLLVGFLGEKYQLLPQSLSFQLSTNTYFILNLSFLVIAMVFCWTTVANGIKALVTFQANSDSSVAVAAVASLAQSILAFFVPASVMSGSIHLYSALAVGALFLNTAGKLSMITRINRNFHFISSPEPKQSVELYDDYNTALQMAKGCVTDTPVIAYQCKTKFFKHFLNNSYEPDPSETASQSIAPVAFICSLVLCIVCLVLSKDVTTGITVFAAAACICTPVTNMLSVNLPISRLCKLARRCGAMVVGYPTVEQFCNTNAVMMDAKELFPKGTVVLNGIKTFGGQRIDEAIVDATALMCSVGGPLSDVFDQIIKSHRDMLPKIDNPVYEDERGVIGWVSGRRILVGNRDLMAGHGIEPPSRDYEEKYLLGGKQIIYLASGGDLVAMFVLSYNSDKRRALELRRMENNGISLIVRTCDPNITPEFLATCFQLDTHSVRVLPERLGSVYKEAAAQELQHTNALLATKGRQTTMLRMLTACVRQKGNISVAVALQNVAVVLGFVLVAFLACYSGLKQISTAFLLVYEIFWLLAVMLIPRLRKP